MGRRGRAALGAVTVAASLAAAGPAFGAALPLTGTLDLGTDADQRIEGPSPGTRAGFAVAPAGDVNGDKAPDMIVGGRLADRPGGQDAGAAWVVFGDPASPGRREDPVDLGALGSRGFRIDGAQAGDEAGFDVAAAGDVNGDGLGDVLVGARLADPGGRKDAGAAYVVYGGTGTGTVDLGALGDRGVAVAGAAAGDELGFSVASMPDSNADGRRDLLLGAPRTDIAPREGVDGIDSGSAFVVYTPAAPAALDAGSLGAGGYRLDADRPGLAGWSVAALPDSNADGLPELIVGAPFTRGAQNAYDGAAYVVYGRAAAPAAAPVNLGGLGEGGYVLTGRGGEVAGGTVAALGDLNGDARPEVAVARQLADPQARTDAGAVQVVFGRTGGGRIQLRNVGGGGFVIQGAGAGDELGAGLADAGDFNGDSRPDLLLGAPYADPLDRVDAGAAYVVFGGERVGDVDLGLLGNRGVRLAGGARDDFTGRSVGALGDISGDGRTDVAVGSLFASPRQRERAGAASVVLGPEPAEPDPIETLPPDPGAEEEERLDGCTAAKNVQAIIDDSGSMSGTDPLSLRARALKILLTKERNVGERLGAVEFGSDSAELFFPLLLGTEAFEAERKRLLALVDERVQADQGGTDYNAGFAAATFQNEAADARIFLTDGAHNEGVYEKLHRGGPRTFVVGLGIGAKGRDARRLQRIADETKGRYYPSVDDEELQPVLNSIDSRLNCDIDLTTFEDVITSDDRVDEHDEELDEGTSSGDITLSWDDPAEEFDLDELELEDADGDTVARFSRRRLRRVTRTVGAEAEQNGVRITGTRGDSFKTFRVRGIRRVERLRFEVRGRKLRGRGRHAIVTQVAESRRRR